MTGQTSGRSVRQVAADAGPLVAAGAALLAVQLIGVRELGSTLFSTELVVFAATLLTLVGPSVGYLLAPRLRRRSDSVDDRGDGRDGHDTGLGAGLLTAALGTQLILPFGLRALCALTMAAALRVGLAPVWGSALYALLAALLLLLPCAVYAALLPVRAQPLSLPTLYAAELCGALLTLLALGLPPSLQAVLRLVDLRCAIVPYALLLPLSAWGLSTAHGARFRRTLTATMALLATLLVGLYPRLDAAAMRAYLRVLYGHADPHIVQTIYSPYQRIDVVADPGVGPSLYLDGVPHFRAGDLTALPILLADFPGALRPHPAGEPALVLGSGSFGSAAHLQRLGHAVTVVELDREVAALGLRYLGSLSGLAAPALQLVIDDGRRFLARAPDAARYGVIALDVPAPYHLQTALLYTADFYRLARAHLARDGVVAISLCDGLAGAVGSGIAAAALQVFPQVAVVESETLGMAVLYAGDRLPFSVDALLQRLGQSDSAGGRVLDDASVRAIVGNTTPHSARNLAAMLWLSRSALIPQGVTAATSPEASP